MKCYNAFGIKPTNSFTSAGSDYYIPNLDTPEKVEKAYKAFEKSYEVTAEIIESIVKRFEIVLEDQHLDPFKTQIPNLVHLYFALYDPNLEEIKQQSTILAIHAFINEFVIYDETNNKVGVKMHLNDTLFINSGIKVKLPKDTAGVFRNKSGRGKNGWDVRAEVVDEDYSGYVHLSQAYTKDLLNEGQNIVYCGDKLVQMLIIPVLHTTPVEIPFGEYNELMSNTQRGDSGFGSSDVKH